jgi:hypothetical protein
LSNVVPISNRKRGTCAACGREDVYISAFGKCSGCYAQTRRSVHKKILPEDLHNPDLTSEVKAQKKQWSDLQHILIERQIPDEVANEIRRILLPFFAELVPHLAKEVREADLLRPMLRQYIAVAKIGVDVDNQPCQLSTDVNDCDSGSLLDDILAEYDQPT